MNDVLLMAAMDDEAEPMMALADWRGPAHVRGGATIMPARIGEVAVRVVRSGIGLVNAATSLALAVSEARPRLVLAIGTAGGLAPEIRVGDIAVGSTYVYGKADARAFGYELGQVPGMPPRYEAPAWLVEQARAVGEELRGDGGEDSATGSVERKRMIVGQVLSSDVFVAGEEAVAALSAFPGSIAVDMESAALAQACFRLELPFVSVRAISDLCGPSEFDTHLDGAALRSATFASHLVRRIAASLS